MYLESLSHPSPSLYARNLTSLSSHCITRLVCNPSGTLVLVSYRYPTATAEPAARPPSTSAHQVKQSKSEECEKHGREHEMSPAEHIVYRASLYYTTRGLGRTVGLQSQGINIVARSRATGVHAHSASTSLKKPQRQPPERIGSVRLSSRFPRSAMRMQPVSAHPPSPQRH